MRRSRYSAVFLGLVVLVAACGDDDSTQAADTTPVVAESVAQTIPPTSADAPAGITDGELCSIVEEVNSTDEFPSIELMDRYYEAAPPELQEPVKVVMDAVKAADGDFTVIFSDAEASAALERITELESELCDIDTGPDQDPSVTVLDESATRVDVDAVEYAFDAELPDTAGRYSFVMENTGEEMHIMVLIRLEDGVALDTALSSQGDEGVAEEFSSAPAAPGASSVITADLGAGSWVLLCPIPGPEGRPHFADGMISEFTVA